MRQSTMLNSPIDVLDHLWLPLGAYNIGLPHRHPFRLVADSRDYRSNLEKVKEVITSTYHIDPSLFCIIDGENGRYAAILMSANQENIKVIEGAMQKLGFDRANPADTERLEDVKHRFYLNLRFEPTSTRN